jgi:hypothetical protein
LCNNGGDRWRKNPRVTFGVDKLFDKTCAEILDKDDVPRTRLRQADPAG